MYHGLSIIPDPLYGDLEKVKELENIIEDLRQVIDSNEI